jgi:hypothetical protein
MPEPRRTFQLTLAIGVAAVYGVVAIEVAHAHYLLVSDYIDITMIHGGWWPAAIGRRLVDPFAPGAWLYRPFADAMSWLLALALEQHVGAWHVLLIGFRLISAWAAYAVAREFTASAVASCTAAAYFAFFPAIPEIDLTRVETYLMVTLALAFYGYCRLARGATSMAVVAMTAFAFIAATMSKEVVAPILFVLLCFVAPLLWRRGAASRWLLAAMVAAMANQAVRFILLAQEPYAHQRGGRIAALMHQTAWVAKILLLVTTNFPLIALLLAAWLALGARALLRDRSVRSFAVITLAALSVGMAALAPYPAIRYLSPSAFFLVPILGAGVDESRRMIRPRIADIAAYAALLLMIVFGGAQLAAQAASMRNSTAADWRLLQDAATALANGRNVSMLEDFDFERAFWVRGELAGVDARYPFITYVAARSAAGQPIDWPPPATGPVNLTGLVPANPRGRFATVRPPYRFERGALVIPANPGVRSIPADVAEEKVIDFRDGSAATRVLARFYAAARKINPKFHYLYDLGETEFPGHYWVTFAAR